MKRSTNRILTSHAGSLIRPPELREAFSARGGRPRPDDPEFAAILRRGVADVVQVQARHGIDVLNDGEFGKPSFINYVPLRFSGFERRDLRPGEQHPLWRIAARDVARFPEFYAERGGPFEALSSAPWVVTCTGPVQYINREAVQLDLDNFKAALQGVPHEDAFIPAVAPGMIENVYKNEYYPTEEAYLYALADGLSEEYRAIVDAGFVLQIDGPNLADDWQAHPEMSVADYQEYAAYRTGALNYALRGIPPERVRFHMCWGSWHGTHVWDIPLRDIVELLFSINAQAFSIEAANPRHEHEWRVWQDVKLPDDKILIPGVIGHAAREYIEHPELIAERIVRFANLVGRENVIAGSDCGMSRCGHDSLVWAKFDALAEGARLATQQLWGRVPDHAPALVGAPPTDQGHGAG